LTLSIIVAFDENRLIGANNQLPWHLPADLKQFKSITMGHHMIMGRKTFESIGKPLPGRTSVIISRNANFRAEGTIVVHSLKEAVDYCRHQDEVFVIGGAQIFTAALEMADKLYLTRIHHHFEGDTYFPEISENEWVETEHKYHEADEKNPWPFSFMIYTRKK
jgi:dihydrofolate reductase